MKKIFLCLCLILSVIFPIFISSPTHAALYPDNVGNVIIDKTWVLDKHWANRIEALDENGYNIKDIHGEEGSEQAIKLVQASNFNIYTKDENDNYYLKGKLSGWTLDTTNPQMSYKPLNLFFTGTSEYYSSDPETEGNFNPTLHLYAFEDNENIGFSINIDVPEEIQREQLFIEEIVDTSALPDMFNNSYYSTANASADENGFVSVYPIGFAYGSNTLTGIASITNIQNTVVTAKKLWDGKPSTTNDVPDNLYVGLFADGELIDTKNLNGNNIVHNGNYSGFSGQGYEDNTSVCAWWKNLPVAKLTEYGSVNYIDYTIKEGQLINGEYVWADNGEKIDDYYANYTRVENLNDDRLNDFNQSTYTYGDWGSSDVAQTWVVNNTIDKIDKTKDITITKTWEDINDFYGLRPNWVRFSLYKDETKTTKIDDYWMGKDEYNNMVTAFTDLSYYDENDEEIIYYLEESGFCFEDEIPSDESLVKDITDYEVTSNHYYRPISLYKDTYDYYFNNKLKDRQEERQLTIHKNWYLDDDTNLNIDSFSKLSEPFVIYLNLPNGDQTYLYYGRAANEQSRDESNIYYTYDFKIYDESTSPGTLLYEGQTTVHGYIEDGVFKADFKTTIPKMNCSIEEIDFTGYILKQKPIEGEKTWVSISEIPESGEVTFNNTISKNVLVQKTWAGAGILAKPDNLVVGLFDGDTLLETKDFSQETKNIKDVSWESQSYDTVASWENLPMYKNDNGSIVPINYTVKEGVKVGNEIKWEKIDGYYTKVEQVDIGENKDSLLFNITNTERVVPVPTAVKTTKGGLVAFTLGLAGATALTVGVIIARKRRA